LITLANAKRTTQAPAPAEQPNRGGRRRVSAAGSSGFVVGGKRLTRDAGRSSFSEVGASGKTGERSMSEGERSKPEGERGKNSGAGAMQTASPAKS
jgi:hypothetical protein